MSAAFEADLCPQTGSPRIRLNYTNGWSASIVLRGMSKDGCHFLTASVAACPTGQWGTGKTELLENEADAEDLTAILFEILGRDVVS